MSCDGSCSTTSGSTCNECTSKCTSKSTSSSSCSESNSETLSFSYKPCSKSSSRDKCVIVTPSCFKFKVMITNTNNGNPTLVQFTMKRKNGVVTLQWPQFSGVINANGIAFVAGNQSLPSLPPYVVDFPISGLYNGSGITGMLEVDPNNTDQLKFYLNPGKNGSSVVSGDSYTFYGSAVQWISS